MPHKFRLESQGPQVQPRVPHRSALTVEQSTSPPDAHSGRSATIRLACQMTWSENARRRG